MTYILNKKKSDNFHIIPNYPFWIPIETKCKLPQMDVTPNTQDHIRHNSWTKIFNIQYTTLPYVKNRCHKRQNTSKWTALSDSFIHVPHCKVIRIRNESVFFLFFPIRTVCWNCQGRYLKRVSINDSCAWKRYLLACVEWGLHWWA